ncbi:SRPBCC family protein [Mangrovihabitans endophyticus]|uniref:Polyketide cyclase / dehydrase and lipid transport n=1 Tax=Mangrovihabitans endophyticus TaxID=1751298 RepID=A0A8J3FQ65_9ACTN|nr:SRPBCC family protein [Mangrovihabitans endophyticus]GGL04788.1 hypothetical protein GCM10012284_44190 [Mangrovihabitans endophyticus]
MDVVTGAQVAVTLTVPTSREHMWDRITAVDRIGEWSPEATGAAWSGDGTSDGRTAGPVAGARFTAHNRFPNGFESTVTCVVVEARRPSVFAWTVVNDSGEVGSTWRYELRDGSEPETSVVHHSFTHGPGPSGVRPLAEANPQAVNDRLVMLCRNMTTTIAAMAGDATMSGETR